MQETLLLDQWTHLSYHPVYCCFLNAGNGISVEGALLTEQDVNHPKPAKRARTSFTADQLQVDMTMNL